ncbi:MAG: hypothetical protein ABWX82_03490 [Leifsonia sp.]
MSYDEKNAWAFLVISFAGYACYLAIVLTQAAGGPITEVDYIPVLLWTIGAAILAGIVAGIVIGMVSPRGRDKRDQRDREISRFGEHVGQSFVVIGAVGALILALLAVDYFWIANVVYLCFVLSALLGSVARIVAYRRGFQTW